MQDTQDTYSVTLKLHGDLYTLLQRSTRTPTVNHIFHGRRSVKDLIESLGIPHTEIDLIKINNGQAGFSAIVEDGAHIEIYPSFSIFPIYRKTELRQTPLQSARFVLDVHLGTLARRLRLLGFDTNFEQGRDDPELSDISAAEDRILLTRDRRLLMRGKVIWGMLIRNTDPSLQTAEVLNRLSLWDEVKTYTRCISCNGLLYNVEPDSREYEDVLQELPDGVTCWCTEYVRCSSCYQIFWKGSHFDKMENILADLRKKAEKTKPPND